MRKAVILRVALVVVCLAGLLVGNSHAEKNSKCRKAIREFADNVLRYARETYGPKTF